MPLKRIYFQGDTKRLGWWWTLCLRSPVGVWGCEGFFQGSTGEGRGSRCQGPLLGLRVLRQAEMVFLGFRLIPAVFMVPQLSRVPSTAPRTGPYPSPVSAPPRLLPISTLLESHPCFPPPPAPSPQHATHTVRSCGPSCCLAQSTAG